MLAQTEECWHECVTLLATFVLMNLMDNARVILPEVSGKCSIELANKRATLLGPLPLTTIPASWTHGTQGRTIPTSLVSRLCVLHGSRLGVQMVSFLSRLRANRGAHARKFRVCVEKGWGAPTPFPHRTLSSRSLDLSSRGLSTDASRPQQPI